MILQKKYNRDDFLEFQKQFLPDFKKDIRSVNSRGLQVTKDVFLLGQSDQLDLQIFEFTHTSSSDARVSLAKDGFRVMKDSATYLALAAYHSEKSDDWRLSLMTANLEINEKGRVKQSFSNPRRYSFFLGPDAKMHTPEEFLVKQGTVKDVKNLISRFDVEVVTREFFTRYKQLFDDLHKFLSKDDGFIKFANKNRINIDSFAKKILGQIVFCYFLQKKGWLGASKGEGINEGKKDFMRWFFNRRAECGKSFYNDCLEHLFYGSLNIAPEKREELYRDQLDFQVPFLNGGLFEPLQNYDWQESFLHIPDTIFSNKEKTGILDVFDLYNFTVHEDDPVDREVSVDPEMLGKVFENLLPENLRKGQGTYYTPREIVHYMCQESLINHLITETDIDEKSIRNLIELKDHPFTSDGGFVPSSSEAEKLDKALAEIKVCDPACGSGAFLVGMLHEIVSARRVSNPKKNEYRLKREAIQNSIYGVDIDPGAVEIAKLRLWLSLVVDYELRDIEPLPNLDFKIVCANSLVTLAREEQVEIWGDPELEEKIKNVRDRHFNTSSLRIKEKTKKDFKKLMEKNRSLYVSEKQKQLLTYHPFNPNNVCGFFDSKLMFGINGFDIIVANPPYLKERDNKKVFEIVNNSEFGKQYHQGKMDYWYYFLHKAIDLVRRSGVISYITSRYWINSSGARKLIQRVQKELSFIEIVDIGKLKVFDEVSGHHMVAVYQKNKLRDKFICKKLENDINDIDKWKDTENVKIQTLSNESIFHDNEIIFQKDELVFNEVINLGQIADISQGVVEAIDKLSKKAYGKSKRKDIGIGDGVFVLNKEEVVHLGLTKQEKEILKKYIDPGNVRKYSINWSGKYLIYADKQVKFDIKTHSDFVNIKLHLDRFKEFITSSNRPYGLHRPRDIKYFINHKIIVKNMFVDNEFAIDTDNYFVGFSFSSVIQKDRSYDLKYILAVLNSRFALRWFYQYGKKRGAGVDIGVDKLRSFPIKRATINQQKPFALMVDKIMLITRESGYFNNDKKQAKVKEYERQIDQMVYKLYNLTPKEIEIVENE